MIQNSEVDVTGFICRCWYVELFLRKILIYRFNCHDYTWELEISLVDDTPGRIKVTLKRLYDEPDKIYNNSFVKSTEPINNDLMYFSNKNVINKYIPSKCPLGTMKIKKTNSDFIPVTTTKIESLVDLYHNDKNKNNKNGKNKDSSLKNDKKEKEEEAWTISYFLRGAPDNHNDIDYSFVSLDTKKCQSVYFEVDGGICCCNCGGYTYPILNIIQKTNFNELKNRLNKIKYLNSSNNNLSNTASTNRLNRIKRSFSSENDLNKKAISKSDLMTNWLQKNIYINRHTNMDEDDLEVCNYKSNNNGYNYYNYIYTSKIRNPQNNNNNKEKDLYKIISFDENAVDRKEKIIRDAMKEYQKDIIRSKRKKEKENRLKKSEKYRIINEKGLDNNNNFSMNKIFSMFDEEHYCYCHCHHYNKYEHDNYQKWEHRSIEYGYFGVFIHKNSKIKKSSVNSKHNKYSTIDTPTISTDYFYSVQIPKYYGDKRDNEDNKHINKYKKSRNNEEELDHFILQDDNDYGDMTIIPCKKYYSLLKKNNLEKVVKDNYARIITEKEIEKILNEEELRNKSNQSFDIKKKSNSEESLVRVVKECFNDSITSEEIQILIDNDDENSSSNESKQDSSELDFSKYGVYKTSDDSLYIKSIASNENFHYKDYKALERNRKNSIFYKDFQELFNIKDHHHRYNSNNNDSHSRSNSYSYSSYSKERERSKSRHSVRRPNSSIMGNYTSDDNDDNDKEETIRKKEIKNKKRNNNNNNNNNKKENQNRDNNHCSNKSHHYKNRDNNSNYRHRSNKTHHYHHHHYHNLDDENYIYHSSYVK
ncbi:hypothetical protein BCR32DRAFT_265524 [Anaeromyces robustus]|uniref:Uncharacterized protein n=1 Tax=Anaeromyces robustus TaxID=1754192 RepID=A0A1Y1XIU2_9FUNG|nr:hypothetical protein BCR32DRAFT_265524 [Anaeromyces robustus]|eukprot:ORX85679.1 hypothetical protein BCR32DRAFT_265524 [Anaeromyces robustus]